MDCGKHPAWLPRISWLTVLATSSHWEWEKQHGQLDLCIVPLPCVLLMNDPLVGVASLNRTGPHEYHLL